MMLDSKKVSFFQKCSPNILTDDANINKIITSEKFPWTKKISKYFVTYQNNEIFTPLCVFSPKMSWYLKNFNDAKAMSFKKD